MSKPKAVPNTQKPFDRGFVLEITKRHMLRDAETSIEKTLDRVSEFEGNGVKSQEVLRTLSQLHQLKQLVENIQF